MDDLRKNAHYAGGYDEVSCVTMDAMLCVTIPSHVSASLFSNPVLRLSICLKIRTRET